MSVSQYIKDISREYALYVAQNRAIPKAADGLKDSARKALWLIKSKSEKIKTISLAGEMISSGLYLHGDSSASGAISMIAAPYVNNVPLLEGIGTFGTRVAPVDGIAAPRYTYVKKNKFTESVIFNDLDIIPLKDNYDGSNVEPEFFLPLIPMVLLNGVSGLAVGWSTEILPRNFKKLVAATQMALDGKKISGLEPEYEYLDCTTENLVDNTWVFTGKAHVQDTSTIIITELPPGTSLEDFKKRLNKMEEDGLIYTYTDNSTDKINVVVKFKRGTVKDWTQNYIINFFKLTEKKTERIVVIDWNGTRIRQFDTAEQLVIEFVEWRLGWYKNRYEKMHADDSDELKYWQGIEACFAAQLPSRLLGKANKSEISLEVNNITAKLQLTNDQLEKIINLPTYKWAADFRIEVAEKISKLSANLIEYRAILSSRDRMKEIYRSELDLLRKLK